MLGAIDRPKIRELFQIPERYDITLVLALGKPVEKVVLVPLGPDGNTNYYRDAQQVHYVPKRALKDIIIQEHG